MKFYLKLKYTLLQGELLQVTYGILSGYRTHVHTSNGLYSFSRLRSVAALLLYIKINSSFIIYGEEAINCLWLCLILIRYQTGH